ncbi:DUF4185 domain-containing protein [Mycobacteroides franklinii]|uniref:DUF4185 domain-containing protein n=1 Tax=Mycobacteroides franklinii TaxID=948102 RepID=UPI000991CC34|nr:DUF4185 domain-containing protein [Mycobacteroides franklinii]
MSTRRRISVVLMTSAVIGSSVAVDVAPLAYADPCTGPAAGLQPPTPVPDDGIPGQAPPIGRRPAGANDKAPLPELGKLPLAILKQVLPQQGAKKASGWAQELAHPGLPNPPEPGSPNNLQDRQAAAVAPAPPAPAVGPAPEAAVSPSTSVVGWVTGVDTGANTLQKFSISGTDLGIMWDNGDNAGRQVLMAFGDTYGYCGMRSQQWRYNTLLRTQDKSLSHGLAVAEGSTSNPYAGSPQSRPGYSKQIIPPIKWAAQERGIIPTAAISVGHSQYMNYMSIKSWDSAGEWTTNYSATAVSNDNGQNWKTFPQSIRPASPDAISQVPFTPGNENFQQAAYVKGNDGYIYIFGTPPGRSGSGFVSRALPGNLPDAGKHEFWNTDRGTWVPGDPNAATPILSGPVGEMSAQYNTYLKKYLVMYGDKQGDVLLSTSPAPQGPWSPPQVIVTESQMPGGPYAPYLHPWTTGKELYFNLSLWSAYNVMLMRTTLP